MNESGQPAQPLVSVVIPTRNRPHLLPIALACYRHQTYPNRELIIIDDSDVPVDEAPITAAGGRLLRMKPGATLGEKLNLGFAHARGVLIQRMDDDDYYAPDFMQRMVQSLLWTRTDLCQPVAIGMIHPIYLDVRHWELRRHTGPFAAGNTLLCYRADWEDYPYRGISRFDDTWFLQDIVRSGGILLQVDAEESIIVIRHAGHTWITLPDGTSVNAGMRDWPAHPATPESVLPQWATDVYISIRRELLAGSCEL